MFLSVFLRNTLRNTKFDNIFVTLSQFHRDKEALLSDQCKEREENKKLERLEISRKLEIPREHFMESYILHDIKFWAVQFVST